MSLKKKILMSFLIIILIIVTAYSIEYVSRERGLGSATIIKVTIDGKVASLMGVDVLSKLKSEPVAGSRLTMGPELNSVLTAAGASRFNSIEIIGIDRQRSYRLDKKQINNQVVFYFNDSGTVNLCVGAPEHPVVRDVSEIKVNN